MNESVPSVREPALPLGPRQRSAIAIALTLLAVAVIVGAVVGVAWLVTLFLNRFSHVFLPLAVGAVAALVFHPYYSWLRRQLRMSAALALTVVLLSIALPLAGFVWFFGGMALEQIGEMVRSLPAWWERTVAEARERWPQVQEFFQQNPWGQRIRQILEGQRDSVVAGLQAFGGQALTVGAFLARSVGLVLAWAVLPVYFVFFLIAEPKARVNLDRALPFLKPDTRKDVSYLVSEFVGIVVAFFRGQLIVAFLMGLLFAIGFTLVGLSYGFTLGLLLGFLNIIPYLGSIVGLAIALPLAHLQEGGGIQVVGLVLIVFTVVQLIEGYLLTPRIMGSRTGLHPIVIIVAVFFWGSALEGILGMILAIPLTAFLVVFWRLVRDKYVRELV